MHFGPWFSLNEALERAPETAGIVQLRAAAIFKYVKGQSAMVYYAASSSHESLRAFMERTGSDIISHARHHGASLIRFAETEQPERELARLLNSFALRFGSLPIGNAPLGSEG